MNANTEHEKLLEARQLCLNHIEDLKTALKKPVEEKVAASSSNKGILNSLSKERIPVELWREYHFHPENPQEAHLIFDSELRLESKGIYFDRSYGEGKCIWIIDHSLEVIP
jgi:hypothetical protein